MTIRLFNEASRLPAGFSKKPLHEMVGRSRWCGPSAIASVLDITTDDAARMIRKANPLCFEGGVKSTTAFHLRRALLLRKWELTEVLLVNARRAPLRRFIRESLDFRGDRLMLVLAGRHWRLLWRGEYACGLTRRPVCWSQAPNLGSRFQAAYWVSRSEESR